MIRQVRGGLLIVSEIRETLRLFMRLVTERDMLHEKDYIAKITKAREDEDSIAFQRECRGIRLIYINSHQERLFWKNARY